MAAPMREHMSLGKLAFERSSFLHENDRHSKCIKQHYFNSSCHILIPGCEAIPKDIDSLLKDQDAYLATNVPVHMIVDPEFVEGFVKRGEVFMLSHGPMIDSEDCVSVLPTGVLVLSVCKDTYQELGLEGRPSQVNKKSGKYVIELDLKKDARLQTGKRFQQRVWQCLKGRQPLNMDFLVAWKPDDEKVCPSSIQNYYHSKSVLCSKIKVEKSVFNYRDFRVPVISPEQFCPEGGTDHSTESCDYLEVYEWLGACATGVDLSEKSADDFVSSYNTPSPNIIMKHGAAGLYIGMILPDQLQQLVNKLRSYIRSQNIPWCSVTAHGFVDSPVSWQQRAHGFHNNGDNLYTLLIFQTEDYWLYSAVGGEDVCP